MKSNRYLSALALAATPVLALRAQTPVLPRDAVMWSAILSAEDSRPSMAQALGPLAGGLRYPDAGMRRLAVRGLGRLERDTMSAAKGPVSLVELIADALTDTSAMVRAEAANALGQAVSHGTPNAARDTLLSHLKTERDPRVRGMIAQTLGRLPRSTSPDIEPALRQVSADTALAAVLGATRGIESFLRTRGKTLPPATETVARLHELAHFTLRGRTQPARADSAARVRRLAIAALMSAGKMDAATVTSTGSDPDVQVRRLGALALATADSFPDRDRLVATALKDASPMVRYEALRVYGLRLQASGGCAPILQALSDKGPHVVLLAIDLLGGACEASVKSQVSERLASLSTQLAPAYGVTTDQPSWHQSAHALASLARSDPGRADALLPRFATHATWWVRMYAAHAATTLRKTGALEQLAYDANDNVREAAIRGLSATSRHGADSAYIAALGRKDYQLLIAAARALDSTPNPATALSALNAALQRVTAETRETSRDARMALLQRIGTLGNAAQASQVQLYLYDWDPVIAAETARMISTWTGTPQDAAPTSLPYPQLPALTRMTELARSRVVFHMRGGGSFEINLRPFDAPTNVERFARLAGAGYFDGLTFHRVVPNFVIQGGSPGANEYWGDGPYTRDELTTEAHVRGTVGISTRGHDTDDGEIFVNLVDNPRLDHSYTIIGEVTSGMDVVDGVLEGATIEKVEIVTVPGQ